MDQNVNTFEQIMTDLKDAFV